MATAATAAAPSLPDPKSVGQLVAGLQRVAEDDRDGEGDERRGDRTFQMPAAAIGDGGVFLLQRCSLGRGNEQPKLSDPKVACTRRHKGFFALGALDLLAQQLEAKPVLLGGSEFGLRLGKIGSGCGEGGAVARVKVGVGQETFEPPDLLVERAYP